MNLRAFKNTTPGKWVGIGLVTVGLVAMCVCVYFQAKHGWSLGANFYDQVALATMHGLVDIATALLVSAGAILWAWYCYKSSIAACLFALLLTSFSILTVSGFMSGRIAGLAAQKAQLEALDKYGKWTGGTTYKEAGWRERKTLRQEMKANAMDMAKVASILPDSHAQAIASMIGWPIEKVQRWLILISSGMAQAIKYICLLIGFFLRSNRYERGSAKVAQVAEPPKTGSSHGGSSGSGGREPFKPTLVEPRKPEPTPMRAAEPQSPAPAKVAEPFIIVTDPQKPAQAQQKQDGSATGKPLSKPLKVSNAVVRVTEPCVPDREWSRDEVKELIRRQRDGKAPRESSYELAHKTGVPQRSIARWQKRLYGQTNPRHRRYAGNGGGHHATVN